MTELGRPIPPLGVQRIEAGTRRVDVDDLLAFAAALGVSPVTLLMPSKSTAEAQLSFGGVEVSARKLWQWLRAERGIQSLTGRQLEFITRSWPTWELERLERDFLDVRARQLREMTDPLGVKQADRLFEDDDGDNQ